MFYKLRACVLLSERGVFCSVGFTGTIAKGSQTYVCNRGSWTRTGSSSNLYAQDGSKLGTYRSVYNAKTRVVTYYWNIINSAGGYYESGQSISGLQGNHAEYIFPSCVADKQSAE